MATVHSYELNGKKLSFANWISNLSPTETPFCSMTGKEATHQTRFYWQVDRLAKAGHNAEVEGSDISFANPPTDTKMHNTYELVNYTQILRRAFKVSDTANVLANYGRGREVAYQMEKYSLALKRDLESILLSNQVSMDGSTNNVRKTAGFQALVAPIKAAGTDHLDDDTGAYTHFKTGVDLDQPNYLTHDHIREMTYNLFLANNEANVIMFHPRHAAFFAALQGSGTTIKMFDGDEKTFSHYVNTYIDDFGRSYKLVPNRWMPEDALYFFNPTDWTQMVLRAPQKTELSKKGNYQHWMLEMEVGLRHRDPWASGVIKIAA